jgi:hypothetical protein
VIENWTKVKVLSGRFKDRTGRLDRSCQYDMTPKQPDKVCVLLDGDFEFRLHIAEDQLEVI